MTTFSPAVSPRPREWMSLAAVRRAYATGPIYRPSARLDDDAHRTRYRQTAEMLREAYDRMDGAT